MSAKGDNMNLFLLVGIDLLFSVLVGLLVFFVTWNRLCARLESVRKGPAASESVRPATKTAETGRRDVAAHEEGCEFGKIGEKARSLKKKGLSAEQIARKLRVSTGEIQMALALSELGGTPESANSTAVAAYAKIEHLQAQ
jgi:hypothetical protein